MLYLWTRRLVLNEYLKHAVLMTQERWVELQYGDGKFTEEEISAGWFFCPDCDDLLVQECCLDRIKREGVSDVVFEI